MYTCECGASFAHLPTLSTHRRLCKECDRACVCGEQFSRLDSLKAHVRRCPTASRSLLADVQAVALTLHRPPTLEEYEANRTLPPYMLVLLEMFEDWDSFLSSVGIRKAPPRARYYWQFQREAEESYTGTRVVGRWEKGKVIRVATR